VVWGINSSDAITVARQLGNRPATCRKYYIHRAILDAYSDGSLFATMEQRVQQQTGLAFQLGSLVNTAARMSGVEPPVKGRRPRGIS
jgi:DNA topoisomerase IB